MLLLAAPNIFAQTPVSGKVSDEQGGGLPGVTVLVKRTSTGTATDGEGNYSLNVPSGNATLVVSFISFQTKEVAVNNRTMVNVSLNGMPRISRMTELGYLHFYFFSFGVTSVNY